MAMDDGDDAILRMRSRQTTTIGEVRGYYPLHAGRKRGANQPWRGEGWRDRAVGVGADGR
jgi:hypothetical protein